MTKKSDAPAIRFKGFSDAWEQRKAKEICSIGTGKSNTQDQVDDGKYPFYIRSDVPVRSNKYLYDCEAVITIGDGNIGKVFHYVNGKFDLHQRCYKMTDFKDIWGKYFFYYFSTKFYDRAMKMTAKATVDSVRLEMISEMDIKKPPQISEQKQIAEFFANLDNLITLHQRECISFTARAGRLILTANKKRNTSSWEQRKFEEIAVRSSVICSDDTLPRVEYEDIVSGTGRLNKDIYAKQSSKSGIAFHQGDVLYGKLRPYLQNWLLPTFDGLAVGDFWVLQPQNADSSFLYRLIQSRQFDEVANQSTGTKMPRADWKLVSKTVFSIPSNISEQAAIGTYFTALDSLITLHQRKCVFLFGFFQAFISMIFTASTFSWEQRKLGEIGSVSMCRRIFKEQTSETGDIPFYKIGTFGADPDAFISRELFEEYKSKYPYPQKGDILISASGSIGRTVEFAGNNEYFQDSNIVWLNHDERLSNPFLKCFYSVVKWAGIEGSTIKRLYNDNILNTVI